MPVPPMLQLCVNKVADSITAVSSLQGVPSELLHRILTQVLKLQTPLTTQVRLLLCCSTSLPVSQVVQAFLAATSTDEEVAELMTQVSRLNCYHELNIQLTPCDCSHAFGIATH